MNIESSARSIKGLEEEILCHLNILRLPVPRANAELGCKDFVPGEGRAGPHQNAFFLSIEKNRPFNAEFFQPLSRKFNAISAFDGGQLWIVHDKYYTLSRRQIEILGDQLKVMPHTAIHTAPWG
jgi:hypothetical protein